MSTPYNDQWVLRHAEHGRSAACAPAEQGEEAAAPLAADARPARRQRPHGGRAAAGLYKRPKWIDRDT
jgi:hypothetical protein